MPLITIADRSLRVPTGTTVLSAIRTLAAAGGPAVATMCDGEGECGRCVVQVVSGDMSPPDDRERAVLSRLAAGPGARLACRTLITGDVVLDLPGAGEAVIQSLTVPISPDPLLHRVTMPDCPPHTASGDHLRAATGCEVSLAALRCLPARGPTDAVVRRGPVTALIAQSRSILGAAIDLGTTTIAASVSDLETGDTVTASGPNPGCAFGEDLLTRLAHSLYAAGGRDRLAAATAAAINRLVAMACRHVGREPADVHEAVIAGNTGMIHLLLGLDVRSLASAPYTPIVTDPPDMPARDLGLDLHPGAMVHVLPGIGGFVGGDHTAALLAAELDRSSAPVMLVDVGTNTEIAVVSRGRITCCSCASGPAFEGGAVSRGMRAGPGAIDRVWRSGDGTGYGTVDGTAPRGFCGSGLIDALATLLASGDLDPGGRLQTDPIRIGGIGLTGSDVRQLQLAGAAIRAGIELLLDRAEVAPADLDRVHVTGAFGAALNPRSAIAVGLLPDLPTHKFTAAGHLVGEGTLQALGSAGCRQRAAAIAGLADQLDLARHPRFNETFLSHIPFPDPA